MAIWDDLITDEERIIMQTYTRHEPKELGLRPAIVVVDVNYAFCGLRPEPILESIKTFPSSCGEVAWKAIPRIQQLLAVGRELGIPIIYSTSISKERRGVRMASRARRPSDLELVSPEELEKRRLGNTIVKEIEPQPGELLIEKFGPSVFYGTPLDSYLNEMDIDTVVVAGTTTSGCVRGTVIDAATRQYYVGIIEECTFDRFKNSHKINLMDMNAKYGRVISLGDAITYLKTKAEPALKGRVQAMSRDGR